MKIADKFDPNSDLVLYNGDCKNILKKIPNDFVNLSLHHRHITLANLMKRKKNLVRILNHKKQLLKNVSEFFLLREVYAGRSVIMWKTVK